MAVLRLLQRVHKIWLQLNKFYFNLWVKSNQMKSSTLIGWRKKKQQALSTSTFINLITAWAIYDMIWYDIITPVKQDYLVYYYRCTCIRSLLIMTMINISIRYCYASVDFNNLGNKMKKDKLHFISDHFSLKTAQIQLTIAVYAIVFKAVILLSATWRGTWTTTVGTFHPQLTHCFGINIISKCA